MTPRFLGRLGRQVKKKRRREGLTHSVGREEKKSLFIEMELEDWGGEEKKKRSASLSWGRKKGGENPGCLNVRGEKKNGAEKKKRRKGGKKESFAGSQKDSDRGEREKWAPFLRGKKKNDPSTTSQL